MSLLCDPHQVAAEMRDGFRPWANCSPKVKRHHLVYTVRGVQIELRCAHCGHVSESSPSGLTDVQARYLAAYSAAQHEAFCRPPPPRRNVRS